MKNIKLLGIPFDYGQPHTGVSRAPEFLRAGSFLESVGDVAPVKDLGDIDFGLIGNDKSFKTISLASELIHKCIEAEDLSHSFLLNVGGDHGLGLGTLHGVLSHRKNSVIVWADAHGDINTPSTSVTGNFHGMPVSFILGLARDPRNFRWLRQVLAPQKLIFFGPRDLDPAEEQIISELSIQYYSSSMIDNYGSETILQHALFKADPHQNCPIHLSFDVDVFDGSDVQATGTRVEGGPRIQEIMAMGKFLGYTGRLKSMDLVEINPDLALSPEVKKSLELATSFTHATVESAFRAARARETFTPWRNVPRELIA